MTKMNRVAVLAVLAVCVLILPGCSSAKKAGVPLPSAPVAKSPESQPSVAATAYAEAISAVTRAAMTPSYDPSGPPVDAGGAARCFVCELTGIDAGQSSVALDPVEYFLGDVASQEARKDGRDAGTMAYVRNTHRRVDTVPLVEGAPILVRVGDGLSGLTALSPLDAERLLKQGGSEQRRLFLVGLGPGGVEFLSELYTP